MRRIEKGRAPTSFQFQNQKIRFLSFGYANSKASSDCGVIFPLKYANKVHFGSFKVEQNMHSHLADSLMKTK